MATSDAGSYWVCYYRAHHDPSWFSFEYEQGCHDIPASQFVVDTIHWESVRMLSTPFVLDEFDGRQIDLAMDFATAPTKGRYVVRSGAHGRDGSCMDIWRAETDVKSGVAILTVDGVSSAASAGLSGGQSVSHVKCSSAAPSYVLPPQMTGTRVELGAFNCNDVPEDAECYDYSLFVSDSFDDPSSYEVCARLIRLGAERRREWLTDEFGCSTISSAALALDRRRLEAGSVAPTTISLYDSVNEQMRDVVVSMRFVGVESLSLQRYRAVTQLSGCHNFDNFLTGSRRIEGTITVSGVEYPSYIYSGYASLTGGSNRDTCG
jgi:hypothetical protein